MSQLPGFFMHSLRLQRIQEATGFMKVDNSHRLQIGIDDYGPHKLHAPLFQIF